ncbi:MAG: DNA-binding transcriptional regulator [Pseudomonadota bacterium]
MQRGTEAAPGPSVFPDRYRHVQGLARGLELLLALNVFPGGAASIAQLSSHTQLHRTTVRRLLETLIEQGFIRHLSSSNQYGLTLKTRALSSGFRDETWITEIAKSSLCELTSRILWPSDIATLEGYEMVIRDSTHSLSTLSFHPAMVGRTLPLLSTAVGRAYLAFCDSAESGAILEIIRARSDRQGEEARDIRTVRKLLDETRAAGYAFNEGAWIDDGRFNAIAVPLLYGKRVLGCINIIFSKRSIAVTEAKARYLPELQSTARKIEKLFSLAIATENKQ